MNGNVSFSLSFEGSAADSNQIDFYDVSQALIGFQRSLALTTHLVINDEIITQAPALKGAQILALPPEDGSWKITATVLAGVWALGTAPKDTPLGHVIYSVYDYLVSESLGFHVDYDKSILQLYEDYHAKKVEVPEIEQHQLDSLIEKCSTALTDIHRPIIKSETALEAKITTTRTKQIELIGRPFNHQTYEYIHELFTSEDAEVIAGRVSSYNSNTFKGRIYVTREGRPIAFELADTSRNDAAVRLIVASLSVNAIRDHKSEWSTVYCRVYRNTTRSGRLKSYKIIDVSHIPL